MCNGCGYDVDWWKVAKAASVERKRRTASSRKLAKLGDTFLVVTEGVVTEPVYFELLLSDLQLYAVHVVVMPGRASDPRHVIETAADEVKDHARRRRKGELAFNEPQRFDHVWAVIDTDVAVRNGIWNEVKQLAVARKVKLAHSTPCFEYWLLLHLQDTTRGDLVDGDAAKRAVNDALGRDYSTNERVVREAMPLFMPLWTEAVQHAKRVREQHAAAATPDPANPSTEVDRLVCALNDSAPEHARKSI
ncbi:MAG: RloB domain-containing protein [Spartobacteria bacterium]|nr:RloB domain-containing protein [Spartobacteria bacterium]